MAKRFTDTDIWDKEWFISLAPKYKCLVRYIYDRCDVAGIWHTNFMLASFCIGEAISESDLSIFGDRITKLPDGNFFLPDFCNFQYGTLSRDCRPQKKVYEILEKYNLLNKNQNSVLYPINRVLNRVQEKDKEKEEEKDRKEGLGENQKLHAVFEEFRKAYPGKKRGHETEFNVISKHSDFKAVILKLPSILSAHIGWREKMQQSGQFVPNWANLQTWLNQRRWEEELPAIEEPKAIVPKQTYSYEDMCNMVRRGTPQESFEFVSKGIWRKIR